MFPAMAQVKGVAQFVDGFLDNTALKGLLCILVAAAFIEPNGGNDAGLTAQLRLAVDMVKIGINRSTSTRASTFIASAGALSASCSRTGVE